MKDVVQVLVDALYLLALVNPISKVSVLAVLSSDDQRRELGLLPARSTFAAACILMGAMVFGDFLLRKVFHIELYALQLAGGVVVCWVGFNALQKGVFFEQKTQTRFAEIALVPLACPMIAGPATIAACMALRAKHGLWLPAMSMIIALAVNHLIMRMSKHIGAALGRFNVLGAIIRITGLVVMAIGTQMALSGLGSWHIALAATATAP